MKKVYDSGYPRFKVKHLIEILQKLDPELPIVCRSRDTNGDSEVSLEPFWEHQLGGGNSFDIQKEAVIFGSRNWADRRIEDVAMISVLV
jgi:hypothetical protein